MLTEGRATLSPHSRHPPSPFLLRAGASQDKSGYGGHVRVIRGGPDFPEDVARYSFAGGAPIWLAAIIRSAPVHVWGMSPM